MDGPRFFYLAVRLPFYEGAMRIVALNLADTGVESRPAPRRPTGPVMVNLPNRPGFKSSGPVPLPEGMKYTESDQGSLKANPVFRDVITFGRG